MVLKIAAVLIVAFVAFVVWRYSSVARGAAKRDRALLNLLEPVGTRLERKEAVRPEELAALVRRPELRSLVFRMLTEFDRLDLFPAELLSKPAQAEATLVYWLLHPNELQAAPEEIELIEAIEQPYGNRTAEFFVFKYRMPQGHWAGTGWLLGLAGPYFSGEEPYQSVAGGFSRAGDQVGSVTPSELVSWYAGMHFERFGHRA